MTVPRILSALLAQIALLFALLSAVPAAAQTFPALSGRVVDAANIIPDGDEAALTQKLAALETQSGRQLVVATVPSLQDYPIEDFGFKLGRAWAIGEKGKNSGLILLVAPNERKVRIEVGYGLEQYVPDGFAGTIIRQRILPSFKAGDYPGGINAGTDALITQLTMPPEEAAARARQASASGSEQGVDIGAVIFWLFVFFFFILPLIRSLFGGRRRGRRYGGGPVIIWGPSDWSGGGSSGGSSWGGGGGFSGGGGSFGGGGASGGW